VSGVGLPEDPVGPAVRQANATAPMTAIGLGGRNVNPIRFEDDALETGRDPRTVLLTCANCGAAMDERKCKLICRCGYFLSCSDYY
jgi:hypothetical protein